MFHVRLSLNILMSSDSGEGTCRAVESALL